MRAERLEQVAELFARLTTVPPEGRAAYVRSVCANDSELQDELLSLLKAHEQDAGPLDSAPKFTPSDDEASEPSSSGAQVGPYRLIRPIGEGGMGSVWLAERIDGLMKRAVALKRPHVSWIGTLAQRMARERDILAGLEHPNIARLYDAGVTAEGVPYLALEYIEGEPIIAYCDRERLPLRGRLELFLQVLDAVRYAHTHFVIHRDIKPSNILVSAGGRVHLLDFGIAKLLQADVRDEAATQWGAALTPDYASPEQISGAAVGTTSDVYSLGVLLAELLAGTRPYQLERDSRGALEDAILGAEPRAPSRCVRPEAAHARSATPRSLTRALQGDLDNIVLKTLQKSPQARYASVDLFAQDIGRHLQGEAILAQRGSTWYYAGKFLRRHTLGVASAATVALAIIAGATLALWQAHEARREAARAEQVKSFALAMLDSADLDSGAGTATTAVDLLQAARARVESELSGRPAIAAELMTAIAYGLIGQDRAADAATLLEKAVRLSSQANGPEDARTIAAQVMLGEALYDLGKNDEAIALLKSSSLRAHRVHARHAEIDALRWLSSAQVDKGDIKLAVASARAAVAALPLGPPGNRSELLDAMQAHESLANVLHSAEESGVVEEARTALGLAQVLDRGRKSTVSIQVRVLLGQGLMHEGQQTAGIRELNQAYIDARAFLGTTHAQTEIIANLVGNARLQDGDVRGAIAAYQASFDALISHADLRGPFAVANGHYGLGAGLAAAGEDELALPHLEEATRLFVKAGGPNAPLALRSRSAEAFSLARLGRLDAAEKLFASLDGAPFGAADKALNESRLSLLRSLQGRHDEAIALAHSSSDGLKDAPRKFLSAQSMARLGFVLLAAGRTEEAIAPLERAIALYRVAQTDISPDHAQAIALLDRARSAQASAKIARKS